MTNVKPRRATKAVYDFGRDVPTYDLLEDKNLDTWSDLEEVFLDFKYSLESGYYLYWEAVIRDEQGLPLTEKQEEILDELINFTGADEAILYIDEIPRPCEPWYETCRTLASKMLLDTIKSDQCYYEGVLEGWSGLGRSLDLHGRELPLPTNVQTPVEVIPPDVRHRLWLQHCLTVLVGLGQAEDLSLENEDQLHRIDGLLGLLRKHKESAQYLGLTVTELLNLITLPPRDEEILVESLHKVLGIRSMSTRVSDVI